MAWGGGVFTRTYGSTAWQTDASNSVGIVADRHDTNDQDLADGINACINKAGGNTPTADLPMGGYKHTNLSAGSAAAPTFCPGNDSDTGMYSIGANRLGFATGGVFRFEIDASGNSITNGVGFFAPTGGEGGEIRLANAAGTYNYQLDCGPGNEIRYRNVNNTDQVFLNNSVERMRLTAAGNLGIGTNNPTSVLDAGNGTGGQVVTCSGGNSGTGAGSAFWCRNGTTTLSAFGGWSAIVGGAYDSTSTVWAAGAMRFVSGGGSNERGSISSSGYWALFGSKDRTTAIAANCHIDSTDGGIYRSTSSRRYKTDIKDYTKGLEELNTLRPVTYKGINNGDIIFGGLIAEELHEAGFSEFVMYNADNEPEAIAYGNMAALLIQSIKELSAKLDDLTDRVTALEG